MAKRIVYRDGGRGVDPAVRVVMAGLVTLQPSEYAASLTPHGYHWGHLCLGACTLAHDVLLDASADPAAALEYHQRFHVAHVSRWEDGWRISRGAVLRWLDFARRDIDAPQVWFDSPPPPSDTLVGWLEDCDRDTYCDVARLAYYRADGILGDLLEEHGLDRVLAACICANLPASWLKEGA